jgi:transcription elongation factor GreA
MMSLTRCETRTGDAAMLTEVRDRLGSELERGAHELTRAMAPGVTGVPVRVDEATESERIAIQQRIRRLGQLVAGLSSLGDDEMSADGAGYGSEVEVEDLRTRRRERYTLVTGEVLDLGENHVTLGSALGQALLGRRAGDRVQVELPQGVRRLRIVSLVTLPRMPGIRVSTNGG